MLESVEANDLDRPIYGAKNIGAVVNLSERQAFHALERGYLDGDKFGKKWRSTKRRLLRPKSAAPPSVPAEVPQQYAQPATATSQ